MNNNNNNNNNKEYIIIYNTLNKHFDATCLDKPPIVFTPEEFYKQVKQHNTGRYVPDTVSACSRMLERVLDRLYEDYGYVVKRKRNAKGRYIEFFVDKSLYIFNKKHNKYILLKEQLEKERIFLKPAIAQGKDSGFIEKLRIYARESGAV